MRLGWLAEAEKIALFEADYVAQHALLLSFLVGALGGGALLLFFLLAIVFFYGATIRRKLLTNLYMDFNENIWSVKRKDLELLSEIVSIP